MSKAAFNTSPHRPTPQRGQREPVTTTPPEARAAQYPGSHRLSDRATIEALNASPLPAYPGSGYPGQSLQRQRYR